MRLIDVDALLDFIHNGQGKEWFNSTSNRLTASDCVNAQPTIDAVEVVRCGECANRNTCDCPLAYAVESGIGNDLPGDDDFCSYGERMDADAKERGKEEQDG